MRKAALTYAIITVIALLATVVVAVDTKGGNLPKYVDVTFTSIADLDARTDSVLAVCDTVSVDSAYDYGYEKWLLWYQLNCRYFAGLTVFDNAHWSHTGYSSYFTLGKARIWYEERRKQ